MSLIEPRFQFGDNLDSNKILRERLKMYGISDAWELVTNYIDKHPTNFRPLTLEIRREELRRATA